MINLVDIVSHVKELNGGFRPAEQRVADVVLDDLDFAMRASNAELAHRAKVSEPTVTRFCRSIGCDGVRDFKLKLAQSLAVGDHFFRAPPAAGATGADHGRPAFWGEVTEAAMQALDRASEQIDPAALARAVTAVVEAGRIVAVGIGGGSTAMADEAQHRLFRFAIPITAYSDAQLMRMVAATLGPGDLLLAISATGRSREVLDAAEIARQYHATVLALTRPGTPLAAGADIALTVQIAETDNVLTPSAARYGFLLAIDLLATGVAYRRGAHALEKVRRVKYSLLNKVGGDPLDPLGD